MHSFRILTSVVLAAGAFTLAAPGEPTVDPAALDRLVSAAEASQSNALFVHQKGKPVREAFFKSPDKRIYVFSVTKAFTGLALGIAWDRGLIPNIETPVSDYFPEVAKDPLFARVRIRHLLQHTSGIQTTRGSKDIYPQRDFVRFALESPVISPPGEVYEYNNRAINLLSGIVAKVANTTMEAFLIEHLFQPLGIRDYRFGRDKAGNTWAMDGLELKTSDLIRVGSLLANRGRWNDRQIVSERWLDLAMTGNLIRLHRSAPVGLSLFSLDLDGGVLIPASTVDALVQAGLEEPLANRLRSLSDREFAKASELGTALQATFQPAELEVIAAAGGRAMIPIYRKTKGRRLVYHDGDLGNYLIVIPESGLAVVRTIDERRGRGKPNGFEEIYGLTARLLPPQDPPQTP